MKPICEVCGDRHEKHQAHIWPASNTASNKVTASNNASNVYAGRVLGSEVGRGLGVKRVGAPGDIAVLGKSSGSSEIGSGERGAQARKQRWSRESYNAYQREYMRKKRGK